MDSEKQRNITKAISNSTRRLGYQKIKPEQEKLVEAFLSGRDAFGILPTGYGKSLYFACLPLIFDELEGKDSTSIVVVTTPLTAIMKDQVKDGLMHYAMPM